MPQGMMMPPMLEMPYPAMMAPMMTQPSPMGAFATISDGTTAAATTFK